MQHRISRILVSGPLLLYVKSEHVLAIPDDQ